jgi:hypothetical protein
VYPWRDGFQDICAVPGELGGCGVGIIGVGILSKLTTVQYLSQQRKP